MHLYMFFDRAARSEFPKNAMLWRVAFGSGWFSRVLAQSRARRRTETYITRTYVASLYLLGAPCRHIRAAQFSQHTHTHITQTHINTAINTQKRDPHKKRRRALRRKRQPQGEYLTPAHPTRIVNNIDDQISAAAAVGNRSVGKLKRRRQVMLFTFFAWA